MSNSYNSVSTDISPFTQLIMDFKGKNLPDEQIEADYNNTINYPNNYFVAPKSWYECFYTTSRKNMLSLSKGIENIVKIKPPFNRFFLIALFQRISSFNEVAEQYSNICPLTKQTYLIGHDELGKGLNLPNVETLDFTNSGLEKNWIVISISNDEGCALIAEEFRAARYRGFFTTNMNLTNRCIKILEKQLETNFNI